MSPERAPLAVGSVALDAPLVMAPMANVTDVHFHEVLRELGLSPDEIAALEAAGEIGNFPTF